MFGSDPGNKETAFEDVVSFQHVYDEHNNLYKIPYTTGVCLLKFNTIRGKNSCKGYVRQLYLLPD